MKKGFLCVLLIFLLLFTMSSIVLAKNGGEKNAEADFTVQAIHQEYKESIKDYPMVLTLKNNTKESITVTGDENNQLIIWIKTWPGAAEPEAFKFNLYEGAKSIIVKAGETKEIVEVPTGAPGTWQGFYHPQLVTDMNVEIKINENTIIFEKIHYGITGIIRNPLYVGEIISTDNEDGTATLKFDLTAYQEEFEIVCDGNQCDIIPLKPKKEGPKAGLKKSDFVMIDEYGQVIGEIIQVKEIEDGEYEVAWQHEAGEYEGIKLNTANNYGDFYVCYFPKDNEGNYRVDESHLREYEFKATITYTKEPIVIEHEDATFETAGATNIPKLVNLFFKEVDKEIDVNTMELFEKNVQKTAISKEIVHIYDISLLLDGEAIQPNGKVKITIPLDEQMKKYVDLKVVYISDMGEVTEVESEVINNEITFVTDHFSYYAVIGTPEEAAPVSPKTGDSAIIYYALFIGTMVLMSIGISLKKEYIK